MRPQAAGTGQGLATLLQDLADRKLLDSTIIWCCGEFGRTPKIQWEAPWNGGRGHWGKVFSALVAGGGFKGGRVVGASDAKGEEVEGPPGLSVDLIGSIYELLGIDGRREAAQPGRTRSARAARGGGRRDVRRAVEGNHVTGRL